MRLKNRLLAVATVLAMTAAVIYGSTREMRQETEETSKLTWFDREDTIYFWYTDETMTNYVNSAAVSFGEREGVHVIPVLASGSEYLESLNQASLRDEQMPDVYVISHDNLEKAYLAGLAEEINDVENVCNESHFPVAALYSVEYQGKKVAYPLSFQTSVLVYNETYLREWAVQTARKELLGINSDGEASEDIPEDAVFDEAELAAKTEEVFKRAVPATLSDILLIADNFDAPNGVEGIMKWDVSDIFYNYWIVGNYIDVGGEAGDKVEEISIYNQETVECLKAYQALNQFFSIEADKIDYESVIQDFVDGKTVFTIATTDIVARLEKARSEGTFIFDYGIAMMPAVSDKLESRSMSVTNAVAVNGYSKHKELANRFAAYLVNDCAESFYEKTGKVSANLAAESDNGAIQIFKMEYAESIPLPKMMATGNYWLLLERLFAKVWNGEDITEYVQELDSLISAQTKAL
ncbi:MAG: extracellular solute-binding protein [Acetatifactor sp.]